MLLRIVAVLTLVLASSGALSMILARRHKTRSNGSDVSLARRRRQKFFGGILFWVSITAFLFLVTGYFTPTEILIALVISLIVPYGAILGTRLILSPKE